MALLLAILAAGMAAAGCFFVFLPVSMVLNERPASVVESIGATAWILSGLGLGGACFFLAWQMLLPLWLVLT